MRRGRSAQPHWLSWRCSGCGRAPPERWSHIHPQHPGEQEHCSICWAPAPGQGHRRAEGALGASDKPGAHWHWHRGIQFTESAEAKRRECLASLPETSAVPLAVLGCKARLHRQEWLHTNAPYTHHPSQLLLHDLPCKSHTFAVLPRCIPGSRRFQIPCWESQTLCINPCSEHPLGLFPGGT